MPDREKVVQYIQEHFRVNIPELQREFSASYAEIYSVVRDMLNEGTLRLKEGITYEYVMPEAKEEEDDSWEATSKDLFERLKRLREASDLLSQDDKDEDGSSEESGESSSDDSDDDILSLLDSLNDDEDEDEDDDDEDEDNEDLWSGLVGSQSTPDPDPSEKPEPEELAIRALTARNDGDLSGVLVYKTDDELWQDIYLLGEKSVRYGEPTECKTRSVNRALRFGLRTEQQGGMLRLYPYDVELGGRRVRFAKRKAGGREFLTDEGMTIRLCKPKTKAAKSEFEMRKRSILGRYGVECVGKELRIALGRSESLLGSMMRLYAAMDSLYRVSRGWIYADERAVYFPEPVYRDALKYVTGVETVTMADLQREFGVGYPLAGKILGWMEILGFVSPLDPAAMCRKTLITEEKFRKMFGEEDE